VVRPRSALAASLLVGIALGLFGGYLTWGRRPVVVITSKPEPAASVGAPLLPSDSAAAAAPTVTVEPPARATQQTRAPSPRPARPAASASTPTRPPKGQAARPGGAKVQQEAAAQPAAKGPSRVEFVTRPRGARVYVDGRLLGKTPLTVESVAPGARAVRFQLDGYRPWATTVDLAPGQRARVAASLELTAVSQGPR
jgi:hypothetical protein